jgi:hypothetical protein
MIRAYPDAAQLMQSVPPPRIFVALRDSLTSDGLRARLWLADYRQATLRSIDDASDVAGQGAGQVRVDDGPVGRVYVTQRSAVVVGESSTAYLPVAGRGERLGVLQVSARTVLTSADIAQLEQLAAVLAVELLAVAPMTDHFERARRNRALTVAAEIQWSLLPPTSYCDEQVDLAGIVEPAYSVAGDAFDWSISNDVLTVAVLDGASRGVPASMAMALCVSALRNARRAPVSFADQAALADQALYAYYGGGNHIATLLVQVDLRTGSAVVIDAGSPRLVRIRDGELTTLELDAQLPLGMFEETRYIAQDLQVAPGDRLMIVSDGVHGAGSPVMFGERGLADAIVATLDAEPAEAVRQLVVALRAHHTGELEDDAVVLCLDWKPNRS